MSAKEKEPDEVDDEELEESKILLDIDDDIEEDSEENIEEDLSVMEGGYHGSGTSVFKDDRTGASAYHGRRAKDC